MVKNKLVKIVVMGILFHLGTDDLAVPYVGDDIARTSAKMMTDLTFEPFVVLCGNGNVYNVLISCRCRTTGRKSLLRAETPNHGPHGEIEFSYAV